MVWLYNHLVTLSVHITLQMLILIHTAVDLIQNRYVVVSGMSMFKVINYKLRDKPHIVTICYLELYTFYLRLDQRIVGYTGTESRQNFFALKIVNSGEDFNTKVQWWKHFIYLY